MTVLGIRHEDKSVWERRAPLVPDDVAALVREHGYRVVVEPSPHRVFGDAEYSAAGAEIAAELADAEVIFAIKEVPPEKLLGGRTYVFFAHVVKGQPYNMPLLERLLELGVTLIDYECITDAAGRRLIYFSREAGQAGMIDTLHVLGRRLEWEGTPNPLTGVDRAFEYADLADAKAGVAAVGERLRRGFELDDAPLVMGFTGRGHVARGAQEIFDLLPHEEIAPEDLATICDAAAGVTDRFFKVRFGKQHLAQPLEPGKPFDEQEYRERPELFRGGRLVRYLPYVTALVHGVFWTDDYPRFLTRREAASIWKAGARKLRLIGDVTCDLRGSIELTVRRMEPDCPTYVYNPLDRALSDGYEGPGIIVLAVDNLPCELPRDASANFSRVLRELVPAIAAADYRRPFAELDLPQEIRRAVVTHQGRLTPDYRYLAEYLGQAAV